MVTMRGDADIFASFSNPLPTNEDSDFKSRTALQIDEILITDFSGGNNFFNRPIYFSVYGNSFS